MLRRSIAVILVLAVMMSGSAMAAEYYSARTPLNGTSGNKLNNIHLAVDAVNGSEVPAWGRFSFNDTVGPRVSARGYRQAANGRGAMVTGGGVAQAASTLYMALLDMDDYVDIDPVKTYGSRFVDDYVSDPDLAVVTDYDADIDLAFDNGSEPMSIEMWCSDSYVYCSLAVGEDDKGGFWSLDRIEEEEEDDGPLERVEDDNEDDGPLERVEDDDRLEPYESALLGSARLNCGGDPDVLHNVALAADCVDDTTLGHGDVFSFNDIVGPRTSQYGYRRAVNGRGVQVTGGGVAQVASALWLCIKGSDDFAILEKSTYGDKYNQSYVASSSDAILTDYSSGRDFSFRYTGYGTVTIYAYVENGWLCCEIYET